MKHKTETRQYSSLFQKYGTVYTHIVSITVPYKDEVWMNDGTVE